MNKKINIIIANRNTLGYLKLAIKSIRENESQKNNIYVYDDNSDEENRQWLIDNAKKYDFNYTMVNDVWKEDRTRLGITKIYNLAMKEFQPSDICMLAHADMVYGKGFDEAVHKCIEEGTIVSLTRVEPDLYGPEECKIIHDCGKTAEEFDSRKFNTFVGANKDSEKTTKGVFAPSCFYVKDWNDIGGIDEIFVPQSREDSHIAYRWAQEGKKFVQTWEGLVYHFSGKGSRHHKDQAADSLEWQESNGRNQRNFLRLWKEMPFYSPEKEPLPPPEVVKTSLTILTINNATTIYSQLQKYEPYFDEIVIVDDMSTDNTQSEIRRYFDEEQEKTDIDITKKLKFSKRALNKDFAAQHNYATEQCSHDWIFSLDADEDLEYPLINTLNRSIGYCKRHSYKAIAFPRKNFIDGVYDDASYPDVQCRLYHKSLKWTRPVHEMIEPFYKGMTGDTEAAKEVHIAGNMHIIHKKTAQVLKAQNDFYNEISPGAGDITIRTIKPKKKILFDSVLYSNEGISKHAREEAKELERRGWQMFATDEFKSGWGSDEQYLNMYNAFDVDEPDYVTYVNQPPTRPGNPMMSVYRRLYAPNLTPFLAFEGDTIPPSWANVLKQPQVKTILTPSEYTKEAFVNSGINPDKVQVLHHGVDTEIYTPDGELAEDIPEKYKELTKILFVGTWNGDAKDRKGLDILVRAYKDVFKQNKNICLILKLSGKYYKGNNWQKDVSDYLPEDMNILIIDTVLTEDKLAQIYRTVDLFVLPSRGEAFGIPALESVACGTPIIVTADMGMDEFAKDCKSALRVKVLREIPGPSYFPYREENHQVLWKEPSRVHLTECMNKMLKNLKRYKKLAKEDSKTVREKFSWKKVVDNMEEIFNPDTA